MSRHTARLLALAALVSATLLTACNTMPADGMKKPAQADQNPAHQMHYSE